MDGERREAPVGGLDRARPSPQRLGDAVDRPAADRRVAVERAGAGRPGRPASRAAGASACRRCRRRSGRRRSRRRAGRCRASTTSSAPTSTSAPSALHGLQRRVRVGRVEVAADAHGLGRHRAEERRAVRDRLVRRRRRASPRRRVGAGRSAHASRRTTGKPEPGDQRRARSAARSPATHSAISPWRLSGDGLERHVGDVDARARRARARARRPRPGGWGPTTRSSLHRAAGQPGSSSARRSRGGLVPATARSAVAGGEQLRADRARARRRRRRARRASASRLARVDVAPERRVGAGDARRVAEARPGRPGSRSSSPSASRGLADERRWRARAGRWRDRGHQAVVDVGVDRGRARARGRRAAGAGARSSDARRRRRSASGTRWRRRTGRRGRARRRRSRRRPAGGRR